MYKTAHYRRVLWLAEGGPSLEQIVRLALENLPTVSSTKFEYKSDVDVQISARDMSPPGVALYFTLFSEGREAATVENGGPRVNRTGAPKGEEFLKTGVHILLQGNQAGYLADGHTNDGQITGLFHKFLEHAKRPKDETQFGLHPRADRAQIERLLRSGVKSIDLGLSSFATTVNDINDGSARESLGSMLAHLLDPIFNATVRMPTAEEAAAASEIQASVHLGYDGRSAHHLVPAVLARIAGNVADTQDEFKIITRDDNVITRTKLVIRREVSVEGDEVAINSASAFSALRGAMNEWRASGIFDH